MSLESEATLAAIGIDPILAAAPRFGKEKQEDAAKLTDRARTLLLKFLSGGKAPANDFPDFDYDEVSKALQNVGEKQTHALITLLPEPLSAEVMADATRIITLLQNSLGRRVTKTLAKVTVQPPEEFELGRFRRKWMVANDPLVVLRDLLDGSIDSGMVQALADYYPEFFKALTSPGGLVDDAIATMKANRGEDWDIDGDKDKLLQVLLQVQGVNLGLANDFARVAAIQPPPPTVSPKSKALTIETGEELPGQKSASSSA